MREMKNSGVEWIGEIPADWNVAKVKNHFNNTKEIAGVRSADYERLALTMKGVIKRSKDDSDGLQPADFNTYQIVEKNNLIFKLIDLQNVTTSRVGRSPFTGLVSPAYIRLMQAGDILPEFAEYYFLMMWHNEIFNSLGDSGVRSSLNATELLNLPVIHPNLEEQSFIVAFLNNQCSEIDALMLDIEKQIETLEEYKKSLITEVVTKGLNPDVEMKDSGIEWIGMIPSHWDIKKVKYVCNARNEKYSIVNGELDYFALENIVSWNSKYIETENEYELEGSNLCYKNDVVFGKLRPYLAKTFLVDYDRCCSSEFAIFCNFKGEPNYYLYVFTSQGFVETVDNSTAGVKMPRANIEFIKNVFIPIAPINEQQAIVNHLNDKCAEIDAVIADKKVQLETLSEYKKSLIYEYVTGKKEVVD